ncbi:Actin [Cladobotryum mycophilum]|uniref:Actin n=1 Tax=Cladobotryum mycophilum TaxID=491253 RepID=A0ABR0SZ90_9HYPO
MSNEDGPTVVIDNGHLRLHKGRHCRPRFPKSRVPLRYAQPKTVIDHITLASIVRAVSSNADQDNSRFIVGDDVLEAQGGNVAASHPINGDEWDMERMTALWKYSLEKLNVDPEGAKVMLTEPPLNPEENQRAAYEALYDLGVSAVSIQLAPVLALYANGRTTGLVVDSGESTSVVPVEEGFAKRANIRKSPTGGRVVTKRLQELLASKSNPNLDVYMVEYIKRACCAVADFPWQFNTQGPKTFRLPDGNEITLDEEVLRTPEMLFQGGSNESIQDLVAKSLEDLPDTLRQAMQDSVILAGGNTLFNGCYNRFGFEISELLPQGTIRVYAQNQRQYSAWTGGSILTSLSSFNAWVTKEDYFDQGDSKT